MSTVCHILVLMMLQRLKGLISCLNLVALKLALLLRKELYVDHDYPVILRALETGPRSFSSYSETQVNEQHRQDERQLLGPAQMWAVSAGRTLQGSCF